jgi:hypothetical protein
VANQIREKSYELMANGYGSFARQYLITAIIEIYID